MKTQQVLSKYFPSTPPPSPVPGINIWYIVVYAVEILRHGNEMVGKEFLLFLLQSLVCFLLKPDRKEVENDFQFLCFRRFSGSQTS